MNVTKWRPIILGLQKFNRTSYVLIAQQAAILSKTYLIDLNGQNIDVTIDACKNSDNPYKELFGTCEYVSCQQHYWFNHKKNNSLLLIHFNVRSLQKHIVQLNKYLVGFKNQPDIVAISETK